MRRPSSRSGAQGLVLVSAIENNDAWRWFLWAAVLALLVSVFILESRREQRRRFRNDKHSSFDFGRSFRGADRVVFIALRGWRASS